MHYVLFLNGIKLVLIIMLFGVSAHYCSCYVTVEPRSAVSGNARKQCCKTLITIWSRQF